MSGIEAREVIIVHSEVQEINIIHLHTHEKSGFWIKDFPMVFFCPGHNLSPGDRVRITITKETTDANETNPPR